jgi:hypothetical protein
LQYGRHPATRTLLSLLRCVGHTRRFPTHLQSVDTRSESRETVLHSVGHVPATSPTAITYTQRKKRRRRRRRATARKRLRLPLVAILVALGGAGGAIVAWVVSTAASAPQLGSLRERNVGANTEVLAADGTRLGFLQADDISQPVSGDRLPQVLRDATVAIEDERFFEHEGVDYEGIRPRGGQELPQPQDGAGRLDDHDAARPQPLHGRARA